MFQLSSGPGRTKARFHGTKGNKFIHYLSSLKIDHRAVHPDPERNRNSGFEVKRGGLLNGETWLRPVLGIVFVVVKNAGMGDKGLNYGDSDGPSDNWKADSGRNIIAYFELK